MMRRTRGPALALTVMMFCLAPAAGASAQAVWRCGSDGRSYSDLPCPGGRALDVADPRDDDQRAQAQQVALREQQLAQQLRQERQQRLREAQARGQGAAGIKPEEPKTPYSRRHAEREGAQWAQQPRQRTRRADWRADWHEAGDRGRRGQRRP